MKSKIIFSVLSYSLFFSFNAYACITPLHTSEQAASVMKEYGIPISDSTCEWIKKNNVRLDIDGRAEVLSGTAIGWAVVRLITDDNVVSDTNQKVTYADSSNGSSPKANQLLYSAIELSIKQLDMREALHEIRAIKKFK